MLEIFFVIGFYGAYGHGYFFAWDLGCTAGSGGIYDARRVICDDD